MNNNLSKIIIFVFVFVCTGCYDIKTTEEYIYDKIKIDISSCTITTEIETPVSFNGDGEYFITADCYKSRDIILNQIKNWNQLPLTNNLQLLMYGGEKDGITSFAIPSNEIEIPNINKGYYYFLDRHDEAIYYNSDENVLNRFSYNFTIALYNEETNKLYYYELDT